MGADRAPGQRQRQLTDPAEEMLQLQLFQDLPIPRDAQPWKRWRTHPQTGHLIAEQLEFAFRLRKLECDRDTEFDFPSHSVTRAGETSAPVTTAPRSIWDMAKAAASMLKRGGRFGDAAGFETHAPTKARIERSPGVTRHVGASYPVRWTEEDQERERQRRARQKPPRPPKKAKTRGRKLLDLISPEDEFDLDA